MMNFRAKAVASTIAISLILTGCSGGGSNKDESTKKEVDKENGFPIKVENNEKAIKGGTLNVALVNDSSFKGVFSAEFQEDAYDAEINKIALGGLFSTDDNFNITDEGIVTLDFDKEEKKATLKIKDDIKWSDGEPLKAEDLIYAYEVIGDKEYSGVRYNEDMMNVVGMEDYHNGKSEKISGIKEIDQQTIEISYKEVYPGITVAGGGIWNSAMPKHHLKDIAIKDLVSSKQIRENPVGLGAFTITNVVPGESIELIANEHYYRGKPKMDKMIIKRVPGTGIVESLKSGKTDLVLLMPTDIYESYASLENTTNLGRQDRAYSYLGFKLGKWDSNKEEAVTDSKAKMADVNLRKAMGYAIDKQAIGEKFYSNLRVEATSLIPNLFTEYQDDDLKGFPYDPEKAEKLLDDAGYLDINDDGIREDKDGKPLQINFLSRSNGEEAEPLSEYMLQEWKAIGLDVQLTTGRLVEFNTFYEKIKADDPEVDVYFGAWSVATDPSPNNIYGRTAAFNYTRFASKELDKLLANIKSDKAFDEEYRASAFKEWQEYMADEAIVIPMLDYYEVTPVNSRVKGFDWSHKAPTNWEEVELTAEKGVK